MAANLNISIGATIEPLKKAISAVMQTMSQFSQTLGANGEQLRNQIDSAMAEVDQQLKAATSSFENFGKSGKSSTDKSTEAFVPLRRQLREATIEFQRLADKNGLASKEATEAAKRVAELKDQMGDMNDVVNAMHPDSKFNGLRNVLVNAVGGVQALGGAMTLFAGESEQTTQTIAKLQSIMAISAGLNQIGGLADSFKALKIQIASATAGMSTMKVVLASIGIGALIAAVSLLAANWESVSEALSDASVKTERLAEESKKAQEELKKAIEERGRIEDERFAKETKYISASFDRKIKEVSQEIALANARKAGASEIYALTVKQLQIEKDKAAALDKYSLKDLSWLKLGMKFRENMADADFKMKEAALKNQSDITEAVKAATEKQKNALEAIKSKEIALMDDGMAKELALLNQKHIKELADAKAAGIGLQKLKDLQSIEEFAVMQKFLQQEVEAKAKAESDKRAKTAESLKSFRDEVEKSMNYIDYSGIKKIGDDYAAAMNVATTWTKAQGNEQERLTYLVNAGKKALEEYAKQGVDPTDELVKSITKSLTAEEAALKKVQNQMQRSKEYAQVLNSAIKNLAVNGFVALGEAMGDIMSGKTTGIESVFMRLKAVIADFLVDIGKGLIATSIAVKAFDTVAIDPIVGIAAGIAAVALGTILKNKLAAGPSFAVGSWEIPNDMNANIHKGEMIIPRTFADDIRSNKGFGGGRVAVEGLIYGNNLAVISRKTNNRNMRIRGQWG